MAGKLQKLRKNAEFRPFSAIFVEKLGLSRLLVKKKGLRPQKKKKKFPPTKRDFVALSVVTRKERQSRSLRVALRGTLFKQVKVLYLWYLAPRERRGHVRALA